MNYDSSNPFADLPDATDDMFADLPSASSGGLLSALGSGVDKVQELGYRAVKGFTDVGENPNDLEDGTASKWIAESIGQGGSLSKFADKGIARNLQEQQAYQPTVPSYKDIDSVGSAASYVGELTAGSLPYMAAALYPPSLLALGGGLSNEAYEAQDEKSPTRAIVSGFGQMALERIGALGSLGKIKQVAGGKASGVVKSALSEGATESGQDALAQWGTGKSLDEIDTDSLMESFVGGASVGGTIRTGTEAVNEIQSRIKPKLSTTETTDLFGDTETPVQQTVGDVTTDYDPTIQPSALSTIDGEVSQDWQPNWQFGQNDMPYRGQMTPYTYEGEILDPFSDIPNSVPVGQVLESPVIEGEFNRPLGLPDNSNIIYGSDLSQNQDNLNYQTDGKPFGGKKAASISKGFKQAQKDGLNPQVIQVNGGYAWEAQNDRVDTGSIERQSVDESGSTGIAQLDNQWQAEQSGVSGNAEGNGRDSEQDISMGSGPQSNDNAVVQNKFEGLEIQEAPLNELTLSDDVPQFKDGANDEGVVTPLGGKFDRTGVAPIQVWVREDGRKEVVTGRHRLDLARRSNEETIPAQFHYEEDGFTAGNAAQLDAILNIRDNQGQVKDYVNYFQNNKLTEKEAKSEGLLRQALGRRAYAIATNAGEEVIASHSAGIISDEAAERLANVAPNEDKYQTLGLQKLQEGKGIAYTENFIRAVKSMEGDQGGSETMDMFGQDTSASIEADKMVKIASRKQRELRERLSAIKGAAKNPKLAKAEGVDIKDPNSLNKRIEQLTAQAREWDSFHTNPKLVAQIRSEMGVAPVENNNGKIDTKEEQLISPVETVVDENQNDMFGEPQQEIKNTAPAMDLAGDKINKEWVTFSDKTGTKKIPRSEMPQIKSEHRGAMVNFMNARGVSHIQEEVSADSLKPTQMEFSPAKVKKAISFEGKDRSILVSSDNHVLDGHHQWLAKREKGEPVKVIRLNAPISKLVEMANEFPSSEQATEGVSPVSVTASTDKEVEAKPAPKTEEDNPFKLLDDSADQENRFFGTKVDHTNEYGEKFTGVVHKVFNSGNFVSIKIDGGTGVTVRVPAKQLKVTKLVDSFSEQSKPKYSGESSTQTKPSELDKLATKLSDKKMQAAAELAALIKKQKGTLNSGVNPEVMLAVAKLGGYAIAEGTVKFAKWARDVISFTRAVGIDDADVIPYLKESYGAIAYNPGKYDVTDEQADGMQSPREVSKVDVVQAISDEVDTPTEEASQAVTVKAHGKAWLVQGDTKPIKDQLKAAGGSWNRKLVGWIFPNSKRAAIDEVINQTNPIEQAVNSNKQSDNRLYWAFHKAISEGKYPNNASDMKKFIADYIGKTPSEVNLEDEKIAQEVFESAMALYARKYAELNEGNHEKIIDMLIAKYEKQPNLNVKTAASSKMMAYSTPAPISYLANIAAGITPSSTVFEPTAGNGLLLITNNIDNSTVNELDKKRVAQLDFLGYQNILQKDATKTLMPAESKDVVIMNPPFGPAETSVSFASLDGLQYELKDLDHIIAARQLEAMKADGSAVLILGANKEPGITQRGKTGQFLNFLYSNYNVVDHVELDGKVYSRQGAEWPIRVIVIKGKGQTNRFAPIDGEVQRITGNSAKEIIKGLYERYDKNGLLGATNGQLNGVRAGNASLQSKNEQPNNISGNQSSVGSKGSSTVKSIQSSNADGNGGSNTKPGANKPGNGQASASNGAKVGGVRTGKPNSTSAGKQAVEPEGKAFQPIRSEVNRSGIDTTNAVKRLSKEPNSNEFQADYQPGSEGFNDNVLIPVNMASKVQKAMLAFIKEHGSVDGYVAEKLGYSSVAKLHKNFMALQVDAAALAISKMDKGKSIIIADQTGVGKGRQAAAVIRYALQTGRTPVFITQKPNLFSDMYGDLIDIDTLGINPYIMNAGESIIHDGKQVTKQSAKDTKDGLAALQRGEMPKGNNAIFLTYSQINKPSAKTSALLKIVDNAVFVLDESHTGAGSDSQTGIYLRELLGNAAGAVYLSATYAKRPDNIGLYHRTSLGDAADSMEELQEAIENGGLQLQTLLSSMLSEEGELIRRERSFEGISIKSTVDSDNREAHEELFNASTAVLQDIINLSKMFVDVAKKLSKEAADKGVSFIGNTTIEKDMKATSFTSVVHNYISQLTMAIKAESAANKAIEQIKNGVKPVIAVESTMESKLNDYMEANGARIGDSAEDYTFGDVFNTGIRNALSLSKKLPNGDTERVYISESDLPDYFRAKLRAVRNKIKSSSILADIPVSPIDYMRKLISDAGYSVSEITGRNKYIDYSDNMRIINKPTEESKANRRKIVDRFNNGKLDVLILNQSGSTGLSIHASEKFKDKRKRHMIVAQPSLDINTFMQMLGRINRTGQIVLPSYDLLWLDLPSENRPAAVLSNKMKQLNANTSANTDSATSVESIDLFNVYGDEIVKDYLEENPDLLAMMGITLPESDVAQYVTGKLAVLPVDKQREFFDSVEPMYTDHINHLKAIGEYSLDTQEIDLQAEPIDQSILHRGGGTSTFDGDVRLTKIRSKKQGTPTSPDDLDAAYNSVDQNQVKAIVEDIKERFSNYIENTFNKKIAELSQEIDKARSESAKQEDIDVLSERKADLEAKRTGSQVESSSAYRMLISYAKPGASIKIETDDGMIYGLIDSVKYSPGKSGSPIAPSKFKFGVITAGGYPKINLSLTQLRRNGMDKLNTIAFPQLRNLFASEFNRPQFENRYVATGNLIKAFSMMNGRVISFTKKAGGKEIGMLMPSKFNPEQDITKKTYINSASQVIKYLNALTDQALASFGVVDKNGFGFIKFDGQLKIALPVNDKVSREKYLDDKIIKILGEEPTWRKGAKRVLLNVSEKQINQAYDHISPKFSLSGSAADQFKQINKIADDSGVVAKNNIMFNRSTPITGDPVTEDQAKAATKDFIDYYSGLNDDMKIIITNKKPSEIFKNAKLEPGDDKAIKGGFDKNTNRLYIFSANHKNIEDVRRTLREELLVHKGLGVFKTKQIAELINAINETRSSANPKIQEIWADVLKNYSKAPELVQAEEFLGKVAQVKPGTLGKYWNQLVAALTKLLRKAGLVKKGITHTEMKAIVADIASKLRQGNKARNYDFNTQAAKDSGMMYNRDSAPFTLPKESELERAIRFVQDKLNRVKKVQKVVGEAGINTSDKADAYGKEALYYGKVEEDFRQLSENFIKPIADKLSRASIPQPEFDLYLYALHAKERNAYINTIDEEMEAGSGMTDQEADSIIAAVNSDPRRQAFYDTNTMVRTMIDKRVEKMRDAGLIDEQTFESLQDSYQNYVPLKGQAKDEGGKPKGTGMGFNIKGKETIAALGRRSKAESPLLHSFIDTQKAIVRANKNEVGNAMLKLVEEAPNPELWNAYTTEGPMERKKDSSGQVVNKAMSASTMSALASNPMSEWFATKRDGVTHYIKFEDPLIAQQMKNFGVDNGNFITRTLGMVNRYLSFMSTSANPEFMVTNLIRDVQTALFNVASETEIADGKIKGLNATTFGKKAVKDLPKAFMGIRSALRNNDLSSEWAQVFDDFRRNGAKTGYFDMKDLEGQERDLQELMKLESKNKFMKYKDNALKFIEDYNSSVENAVRLSVYKTALDSGVSKHKAAVLAKNLTVNFNRKGEAGTWLNSLFLFANAGIQGTSNFARAIGTFKIDENGNKKLNLAQKAGIAMAGIAFSMAVMNRMISDDDDDGESYWDKIPDYIKERNFVLMHPNGKDYFTLPMPYGYNIFANFGTSAESVMLGGGKVSDNAAFLAKATMGSFLPFGLSQGGDVTETAFKTFTPQIGKPVVDIITNTNFFGSQIYSEANEMYGDKRSDSALGRDKTNQAFKTAAKYLNMPGGGTEYQEGWIDVHPETLRYMVEYLGGGLGATVLRTAETAARAKDGEFESDKTPFVRRFYGKVNDYGDQTAFYDRLDELAKYKAEFDSLRGRDKLEFRKENLDLLRLEPMAEQTKKQLKQLRNRKTLLESKGMKDRAEQVDKQMESLVDKFNKQYNTVMEKR